MKTLKSFRLILAFLLAILLAVPLVVLAEDSSAAVAKRFAQQELDQILAPVAIYPDSLLAQVLMASTYPLEVVMAERWVKQNTRGMGIEGVLTQSGILLGMAVLFFLIGAWRFKVE